MQINPTVFRKYDIRGKVDEDLSSEFAHLLGCAFGEIVKEAGYKKVAVAWDCRKTSQIYAENLIKGLIERGVNCLILGLSPTPQLYWALFNCDCDCGVEVTGSHNAVNMNGFKLCIGKQTASSETILKIKDLMDSFNKDGLPKNDKLGEKEFLECHDAYIKDLVERCEIPSDARKLKVVVDAGNGVAGLVGPDALKLLGCEVIEQFCEPNGFFPNHHPDPSIPQNLKQLQERVLTEHADLGIAWDGDGDRIGVVDEKGNYIYPDILILIYALDVLKSERGASIVADVKCSDKLFELIEQNGGKAVMWHSGHSLMKAKIHELNAAIGGELSGHIFFNHRFYGFDDGSYGACRLVEILQKSDKTLSEIVSQFPTTYVSPEIRIPCPDEIKFDVIEKLKERLANLPITCIDGIRIKFSNGWGLIRVSNTEPCLSLRIEGETDSYLQQYRAFIEGIANETKDQLL